MSDLLERNIGDDLDVKAALLCSGDTPLAWSRSSAAPTKRIGPVSYRFSGIDPASGRVDFVDRVLWLAIGPGSFKDITTLEIRLVSPDGTVEKQLSQTFDCRFNPFEKLLSEPHPIRLYLKQLGTHWIEVLVGDRVRTKISIIVNFLVSDER